VLIIKPSSLGDIVHALPVLAALRASYPKAHIAWLVGVGFAPLLENHPMLDEVIPFDRQRFGRMLLSTRACRAFLELLIHLRRRRFDLVIDLQGLIRSGFLSWAAGGRQRIGFAAARELAALFYSRRVRCPGTPHHAVDRNLCIARALGLTVTAPEFPLGLHAEEIQAARLKLDRLAPSLGNGFIALLPGARWESKRWPARRWAELIGRISDEGGPACVLLGAGADTEAAEQVLAHCSAPVLNLVGKTGLRELVALLHLAQAVVCHDSGPMHLAAALNRPTVAIFGPTDPARTGPYSPRARIVSAPLDCAPCRRRKCPLKHGRCLADLPVEPVLAELRTVLRTSCHTG